MRARGVDLNEIFIAPEDDSNFAAAAKFGEREVTSLDVHEQILEQLKEANRFLAKLAGESE